MTISAQVIDTIVEWIDDNLHQPLRIDDIARHAGYSKWHLQRLFLSDRTFCLQILFQVQPQIYRLLQKGYLIS